jgi:flagellar biosynthetic protein FlhB
VAEQSDSGQKTEQPTPHKIQKSVEEGDVLLSKELATALAMIAATIWLFGFGNAVVSASQLLLTEGLSFSHSDIVDYNPGGTILASAKGLLLPFALLFGATIFAAVSSTAMVGSLGWRGKQLAFKGNRINPIAGLKRMFGTHGLMEMVKSIAKVTLLGGVGYFFVSKELDTILGLSKSDLVSSTHYLGDALLTLFLLLSVGMLVIALMDVPAQWFQRNRRLMMTIDEVRRELRENDGSPEVKGEQRARQREILSGSARKAVTGATVVLTNPTHFSVALRYRPGIDDVPIVVARGRGEIALGIRAAASGANVPILEYPQLTRALYFSVRSGRSIPEDLFLAVATILAFVFRLDNMAAKGMVPPTVNVPPTFQFDSEGRPQNLTKSE